MSKYSEAAGLPTTTHESGVAGTTAPPVSPAPDVAPVVPPTPPVYENPLDKMPVANGQLPPRPEEEVAAVTTPPIGDFKWMSKIKLEEIGRTLGIELDRRLSQPKLVEQLESHIASMDN